MIDIYIRSTVSLPFGATLCVIPGRGWRGGLPPSTPNKTTMARSAQRRASARSMQQAVSRGHVV